MLALLYGELGTLKSFIALDWSLHLATRGMPVLYMSAEGRGLARRIRGWCLHHVPARKPEETMMDAAFFAVERPLALPQLDVLATLEAAIEDCAVPPKLIVADALARYGGILDENKDQGIALLSSRATGCGSSTVPRFFLSITSAMRRKIAPGEAMP